MNLASCLTCGADWSQGNFSPECPECGGGALDAPCPACAGKCGARWQRAVIDSNDAHLAHFYGSCALTEEERRNNLKKSRQS